VSAEVTTAAESVSLRDAWELRNAATATLVKSEEQIRRLLEAAGAEQIIALLEAFSPSRSSGPAWTRSFEPLLERLWTWCAAETLALVEANFRARGAPWIAVANSLRPEHGNDVRNRLQRRSAQARLPAFTIE
jgi:hypothetical protein